MAIERIPLIDNKAIVVCPSTSIFFVPQDEIQFRSFLMTIIVIAAPRGVSCHIDDDDDDDDDDLFCQHVSRMQYANVTTAAVAVAVPAAVVAHVVLVVVGGVAAAVAAACHLLPINTTTCRWWTKAGSVAKKQYNATGGKARGRCRLRRMKTRARGTCQKAAGKLLNKTAKRRRRSVKIN